MKPREFTAFSGAHEITFSCYHGYPFLASDRTCAWLAESIDQARKQLGFRLWAFVFMPNHVHLVIHRAASRDSVARIRHAIKVPVAKQAIKFIEDCAPEWLPRITRTRGHSTERLFWQSGGGYDRIVSEIGTLWRMIEYIHLNPVRKGLVAAATDWQWSSASMLVAGIPGPLSVDPIPPEWAQ